MDTKNMTTKHEIEIPDLPEGWRAVAYRTPVKNVDCVLDSNRNVIRLCDWSPSAHKWLIVEKIKRRRIVFEDTGEKRQVTYGDSYRMQDGCFATWGQSFDSESEYEIWRVIEE